MGTGALSLRVKRPGRESNYSPPSSTECRMRGDIPPLPQYFFMAWCLIEPRDNFTVTFLLLSSHLRPGLTSRPFLHIFGQFLWISHLSMTATCPTHPILLDSIAVILNEEYKLRSPSAVLLLCCR